jgi:hypothetical protein
LLEENWIWTICQIYVLTMQGMLYSTLYICKQSTYYLTDMLFCIVTLSLLLTGMHTGVRSGSSQTPLGGKLTVNKIDNSLTHSSTRQNSKYPLRTCRCHIVICIYMYMTLLLVLSQNIWIQSSSKSHWILHSRP